MRTLRNILGLGFCIISFGLLFTKPFVGIIGIILGISILPITWPFLSKKYNVNISKLYKIFIAVILFLIFYISISSPQQPISEEQSPILNRNSNVSQTIATTTPKIKTTVTPTTQPVPVTKTQTPAPAVVITEPSPINFSGTGQQATQKFTLESGLSIFNMTHDGSRNFIVSLLDNNGNNVGYLSNIIGSFNGSNALKINKSGTYLLNIEADGNWTINIQQPRPTQAPQTTNFTGFGQNITKLFYLSQGLHVINMTHDGSHNFIVSLLDNNGNNIDYLANEIGSFSGSKAIKISKSGIYLLNIDADGNWTISIQ